MRNIDVSINHELPPFQRWQETAFSFDPALMALSGWAQMAARALMQKGFVLPTAPLIPFDDRLLARLCGLSSKEWVSIRDEVLAVFEVVNDGEYITHTIICDNRERLDGWKGQRKEAAAKSVLSRQATAQLNAQSAEQGMALIDRLLGAKLVEGKKAITAAQKKALAKKFGELTELRPERYWRGLITLLASSRDHDKSYYLKPGGPFDKEESEKDFLEAFLRMWKNPMREQEDYGVAVDDWLEEDLGKMRQHWGGFVYESDSNFYWANGICSDCGGPTARGYCFAECAQAA